MDLELSEEQLILKNSAREFLEKECPFSLIKEVREGKVEFLLDLWIKVSDLGWPSLVFPTSIGGADFTFTDFVVLLQEAGRALLPLPLSQTVIAGLAVLNSGNETLKTSVLPSIINGQSKAVLAIAEEDGDYDPAGIKASAALENSHWILTGSKHFINYGPFLDYLIVAARTTKGDGQNGITLFTINAQDPSIKYHKQESTSGGIFYRVDMSGVKAKNEMVLGEINNGWALLSSILLFEGVARCALILGSAEKSLEATIEIAKTRIQFGRAIGSFQAIQQQCADMMIDIDGLRNTTFQAAGLLERDVRCPREVAIARIWADTIYKRTLAAAVKIHGAIGFTMDTVVGLHFLNSIDEELPLRYRDFYRRMLAESI